VARIDASVDVQIEAFAFWPKSSYPDRAFRVSQDEVVLVLRRRRRHVAEQVPARELTCHGHRLPFVLPWFEGDRPDRRRAIGGHFGDACHADDQLLTRHRPVFWIGFVFVAAEPRIRCGQAADVKQLPAYFHRSVEGIDIVENHLHLAVAAAERHALTCHRYVDGAAARSSRAICGTRRRNLDELASENDILQVEVAGKPSERVDSGEAAA
jgi:hypothetical protein